MIASVHLEVRSDVTLLENTHPELAGKFKRLRHELNLANDGLVQHFDSGDSQRFLESQIASRYETSKQFDDIITLIRRQDGFDRFLLGPSSDELKRFASTGPIVFLNTSRFGSDAFLVTHCDIQCLPLPNLEYNELEANSKKLLKIVEDDQLATRRHTNKSMTEILKWLWDMVAEPILGALGFTASPQGDDDWPHVWWIPVGLLSLFPIHAAGHYSIEDRQADSVLDRVISSYTPTVRALEHARNQIRRPKNTTSQTLLLVSMPATPNGRPLPFSAEEVNGINKLLRYSMKTMNLPNPTKSEVLERIEQCSIVHFACHGEVDRDPSKSRILLSDWETNTFYVADMAQRRLDQAELAYISACYAANNRNFELQDESIHMAGAFQLAGFPSVIGTLWKIDDEHSAKVAKCVYGAMLVDNKLDIRRAARGLHFAIRKVREQLLKESRYRTSDPLTWAPYIHVGV